ncbi:hypothetical protein SRHO_G00312350 [Serrasalmus rhombeus]
MRERAVCVFTPELYVHSRALRACLSVYTDTTSHNKEPKPAVAVLRVFPSCITDPPEHNAEYLWVNGSADGQS